MPQFEKYIPAIAMGAGIIRSDDQRRVVLATEYVKLKNTSASDVVMSSGRPAAVSRLAATRLASVCPAQVSTGNPAHNASPVVVCAL